MNIPLRYAASRPAAGPRIGTQATQHPPVVPDRIVPLRRFDNLNYPDEARVPHNAPERVRSDGALGDPLVAVQMRPRRRLGVVEVQALEVLEADLPIEPVPYTSDVAGHVIPRRVQMGRVQAKAHTGPERGRHRVTQRPQLLEARAERGARARGALDEHADLPRHLGEAGGVASRVALQAGRALVHEVSRMADHPRDAEGTTAVQLTDKRPQAALTQTCVRGREVDQVAVVRHDGLDARRRDGGAERVDVRRRDRGLAPLAWRLGEDLDGGCPDRRAARRRVRHAALGRDVCAQQVVRPRIPPPPPPPPGRPGKASRGIRATNRTPPPPPPPTPPPRPPR